MAVAVRWIGCNVQENGSGLGQKPPLPLLCDHAPIPDRFGILRAPENAASVQQTAMVQFGA